MRCEYGYGAPEERYSPIAWRGCMKSGPRVMIHYSSMDEKTLPNGSFRYPTELHPASPARP